MKKFLLIALATLLLLTSAVAFAAETPACDHPSDKVTAKVIAATCTEKGYTHYECTCGYAWDADYVEKLNHQVTSSVYTAATCYKDGFWTKTCSVCGQFTEVDAGSKREHKAAVDKANTKAPTCTTAGVNAWYCEYTDCEWTKTEAGAPALNHEKDGKSTFVYVTRDVKPATCKEEGLQIKVSYCEECGIYNPNYVNEKIVVPVLKHTVEVDGKAVDLIKAEIEYLKDANGNKYLANRATGTKTFPATKKTYELYDEATQKTAAAKEYTVLGKVTVKSVSATCVDTGSVKVSCDLCDYSFEDTLPVLGHEWKIKEDKVDYSDCTKGGYIYYECGREIAGVPTCTEHKQVYVAPAEHNFTEVVYKQQKADQQAAVKVAAPVKCIEWYEAKECSNGSCTATTAWTKKNATATKHNVTDTITITPKSCFVAGEYLDFCGDCLYTYERTEKAYGSHQKAGIVATTKAATCTTAGERKMECAMCNEAWTEEIPALNHTTWGVVASKTWPATCTKDGQTVKACLLCGIEKTEIEKAHHTLVGEPDQKVEATCTTAGWQTYTCAKCGKLAEKEPLNNGKLASHDYSVFVKKVEADCENGGYDLYQCAYGCGKTQQKNKTDKLGHKWGAWVRTKHPTCTVAGEETRNCTRCQKVGTQAVVALGHELKKVAQADGSYKVTCLNNCGYSETLTTENPKYNVTVKSGKGTIKLANNPMEGLEKASVRIAYNLKANGVSCAVVLCVPVTFDANGVGTFDIPNVQGAMTLSGIRIDVVASSSAASQQIGAFTSYGSTTVK